MVLIEGGLIDSEPGGIAESTSSRVADRRREVREKEEEGFFRRDCAGVGE